MKPVKNKIHNEAGLSLLELLLSTGIIAIILVGATTMAQDWAERVRSREEAGYIMKVHDMAVAYVNLHFGEILQSASGFNEDLTITTPDNTLLNNPGKAIMIPLANEGGPFFLKDGSIAMSTDFPETTPSRRNIKIYVRNTGFIGDSRTLEVITVTSLNDISAAPEQEVSLVQDIAKAIGPRAGIFTSPDGDCNTGSFLSAYGSWSLSSTNLGASNMMAGNAYCPDMGEAQQVAYLGLQDRLSYENADVKEYLYRVAIPGTPQANRMETNLDMNGHDITGVSSATVDNVMVNGNLSITTAAGNTAMFVDENFRVGGSNNRIHARIENDPVSGSTIISGGDLNIGGPAAANLAQANLIVENVAAESSLLSAQHIFPSGNITVGRNMGVDDLSTANIVTNRVATNTTVLQNNASAVYIETPAVQTGQGGFQTVNAKNATTGSLVTLGLTADNVEALGDFQVGQNATVVNGAAMRQLDSMTLGDCYSDVKNVYPYTDSDKAIATAGYDCKVGPPDP